jgi:hypothetical protein
MKAWVFALLAGVVAAEVIYVPYAGLKDQAAGVFLPGRNVEALLAEPRESATEQGWVLGKAEYRVEGADDALLLSLRLAVELLDSGPHRIPLPLGLASVLDAEFANGPASLQRDDKGWTLRVAEFATGVHELRLQLSVPAAEARGRREAVVALPGVAQLQWAVSEQIDFRPRPIHRADGWLHFAPCEELVLRWQPKQTTVAESALKAHAEANLRCTQVSLLATSRSPTRIWWKAATWPTAKSTAARRAWNAEAPRIRTTPTWGLACVTMSRSPGARCSPIVMFIPGTG